MIARTHILEFSFNINIRLKIFCAQKSDLKNVRLYNVCCCHCVDRPEFRAKSALGCSFGNPHTFVLGGGGWGGGGAGEGVRGLFPRIPFKIKLLETSFKSDWMLKY